MRLDWTDWLIAPFMPIIILWHHFTGEDGTYHQTPGADGSAGGVGAK